MASKALSAPMSCPSCHTPFSESRLPSNQPLSREDKVALLLLKLTASTPPSCGRDQGQAVAYCTECDKGSFLCQQCWDVHQGFRFTHQHFAVTFEEVTRSKYFEPLQSILPNDVVNCKLHPDERLELLCLSCAAPVCINCVLINKKDASVGGDPNRPTLQNEREGLETALKKIPAAREDLEKVQSQGEEVKKSIQLRRDELKTAIATVFAILQKKLNERERALTDKVSGFAAAKESRLTISLDRFHKLEQDLFHCQERAKDRDIAGNVNYVSVLRAQAEQLLDHSSEIGLELSENAEIAAELNLDQVSLEIECFGYVASGVCPSETIMAGLPAKLAVGRAVAVRVMTMDSSGKEIGHEGEVVRGVLAKKGESRCRVAATAHDRGDGMYLLTLEAEVEGDHSLSVTIRGQHIQGSPFSLPVVTPRDYYSAFKDPVLAISDEVFSPRGLAFAENGDMFLVCRDKHCIRVFDSHGRFKSEIGKEGSGDLEFALPFGIAINGNTVYVADTNNNRIQMLTTSGKFLGMLGNGSSGKDKLSSPLGVSVSENGTVYVGDRGSNNRVQIFRADGTFLHSISGSVSGKGAFNDPFSLALAPNGDLHVLGYYSKNVTVFTGERRFVRSYEVPNPRGIAIDRAGFSLVTGHSPHALYVYDPIGQLVKKIEGFNTDIFCVAVAPDGSVWVSVSIGPPCLLKY